MSSAKGTATAVVERFATPDALRTFRERCGNPDVTALIKRAVEADYFAVSGERNGALDLVSRRFARGGRRSRQRAVAGDGVELALLEGLDNYAESLCIAHGNLFLNEGINNIWNLVCGAAATAYNNANARVGVGDSATAAAAGQTDLQAATNKLYQAVDASFPTSGTSQQAVFKSTFGASAANFHWQEETVDNGSSAALNIDRLVQDLGTKVSPASWALTLTLSLS